MPPSDKHVSRNDNAPTDAAFDEKSGTFLERLIFCNRIWVLAICVLVTLVLGIEGFQLKLSANFENEIPKQQEFIQNYFKNIDKLQGQGNSLQIVVQANKGSILTKSYLETLKNLNDRVFLLPGVNRSFMQSLWTPNVRWIAVTDQGLNSGTLIPGGFTGSTSDIAQVAQNINRAGLVGQLVAPDYRSSMIRVPLLDIDQNGKALNYSQLARSLNKLRAQFAKQGVILHITGFAMIMGDMILALRQTISFFIASALIATAFVFWYTRCIRSTALVVLCSSLAVIWQLGAIALCGYALDPYSILVPFLIFAIGMSHGSQKMNGVMQDIGRGNPKKVAARLTFRRLFMAGFTALLCDALGFAVLMTIQITAIRELAIAASIGVALLVITNLILLPVLLSYIGVSSKAARLSVKEEEKGPNTVRHPLWRVLDIFTHRRYASLAIVGGVVIGCIGAYVGRSVQIGDIDKGAPELRVNSLYNRDNAYIVSHYSASSDVFIVMVKTPDGACANYKTLVNMETLETKLDDLPGVISTYSLADFEKQMNVQMNEGSYAWYGLMPNQSALDEPIAQAPETVVDRGCNFLTISVFLADHRAGTLNRVVNMVHNFSATHNGNGVTFIMAAGNAGIDAATNRVIAHANKIMLFEVYAAVILLCLITFRSWRAVIAAVLPLILTSLLAQALMVWLGIGVKVATLPVTALGVGIGVDYALYILSVMLSNMRKGMDLSEAYYQALIFTGKVVMLTGFTLAIAVGTWAFSPIKFQADMGKLLAFMFLWNMLGALILLPSLASFLLPKKL